MPQGYDVVWTVPPTATITGNKCSLAQFLKNLEIIESREREKKEILGINAKLKTALKENAVAASIESVVESEGSVDQDDDSMNIFYMNKYHPTKRQQIFLLEIILLILVQIYLCLKIKRLSKNLQKKLQTLSFILANRKRKSKGNISSSSNSTMELRKN